MRVVMGQSETSTRVVVERRGGEVRVWWDYPTEDEIEDFRGSGEQRPGWRREKQWGEWEVVIDPDLILTTLQADLFVARYLRGEIGPPGPMGPIGAST